MQKRHWPSWPLPAGGVLVLLILLISAGAALSFQTTRHASQHLQASVDIVSATQSLLSNVLIGQAQLQKFAGFGDADFTADFADRKSRMQASLHVLAKAELTSTSRASVQLIHSAIEDRFNLIDHLIEIDGKSRAGEVAVRETVSSLDQGLIPVLDQLTSLLSAQRKNLQEAETGLGDEMRVLSIVGLVIGALILVLVTLFVWLMGQSISARLRQKVEEETILLLEEQTKLSGQLAETNESLRASDARFSVMLDSIGDGVLATDADACITLLNPVAELLTGWTSAQALGLPIQEVLHIIHKDSREPAEIPILDTLARGTVHGLANHTVLIAKGGQEFDIADSCAAIRDSSGRISGAILVFRDVSDEYAIEQQLRDSNGQIRSILNTVVDGVITLDAASDVIQTLNPAAERMFDYTAAELEGLNFRKLVPDLDQVKASADPDYYSAGNDDRSIGMAREVVGRRKDGSEFPLEMAISEMWVNGRRHFTGVLRDITARKRVDADRDVLNERLRDQHFYVRSLIESNVDAMMTSDPSGIISDVNKQMEFLTGCTRDELIGSPFKSHFAGVSSAEQFIDSVLALNKVTDFEMVAKNRSGTMTNVSCNATTYYSRERQLLGVFASVRDVTDRKLIDRILMDSNVELERAKSVAESANRAKSEFLSSMSHELRTPLSAILGFAQLIDLGVPQPTAAQKRSVDQILKAGWYLLELINEVLDLALVESGNLQMSMEPIELSDVLLACRDMVQPQARERNISLNFNPEGASSFVRADRVRLKQVLINLLSNAIKYNRQGGSIFVDVGVVENGRQRITVRDTGEGLATEKLQQLFQPFNRLGQETGSEEGTGIGLVVSKRLVELMEGSIGAQSVVGTGSSFWIELAASQPVIADDYSGVKKESKAAPDGPDPTHRTLLYVEDNSANLMLVEDLISRRPGIRLLTARTGQSGVELACALIPDVILMDINLPGLNGLQALRLLAENPSTAHIPVIAISANAMPADISKGLKAGFDRYLTKPVKVLEFLDMVDEVFAMVEMRYLAQVPTQPDTE